MIKFPLGGTIVKITEKNLGVAVADAIKFSVAGSLLSVGEAEKLKEKIILHIDMARS